MLKQKRKASTTSVIFFLCLCCMYNFVFVFRNGMGEREDAQQIIDKRRVEETMELPSSTLQDDQMLQISKILQQKYHLTTNLTNTTKRRRSPRVSLGKASSSPFVCAMQGTRKPTISLPQFPNFIIAGAQKGGTTALQTLLRKHPNVLPAHGIGKSRNTTQPEPHFFDLRGGLRKSKHIVARIQQDAPQLNCAIRNKYAQFWDLEPLLSRNTTITNDVAPSPLLSFEKTPDYMYYPIIPSLVYHVVPWTKIIFMLRDPVDRWFSEYEMEKTRRPELFRNVTVKQHLLNEISLLRNASILPFYNDDGNESLFFNNNPLVGNGNLTNTTTTTATNRFLVSTTPTKKNTMEYIQQQRKVAKDNVLQTGLHKGMYAYHLLDWMEYFPLFVTTNNNHSLQTQAKMMIVRYEDYNKHPSLWLYKIQTFVGLPIHSFSQQELRADYSPTKRRTTQTMQSQQKQPYKEEVEEDEDRQQVRTFLIKFYKSPNQELVNLLGTAAATPWEEDVWQ